MAILSAFATFPASSGPELDPAVAAMLAANADSPPTPSIPVPELRANMERIIAAEPKLAEPIADVRDLAIGGDGAALGARVFIPNGDGPFPAVVFLHGGGWVMGSPATHHDFCRSLCSRAGAVVVSVDYRLAPEHPFPAALDDGETALRWVADHASELRVDPDRLAVAGDSAGGNLAAALALRTALGGGPKLELLALVYPAVDAACDTASHYLVAEGCGLTRDAMRFFWRHYLGDPAAAANPEAAPLLAPRLDAMPPAVIVTAELDPLRDDGEAFGARLAREGVRVSCTRYLGMNHGFINRAALFPQGSVAIQEIADALRAAFAP